MDSHARVVWRGEFLLYLCNQFLKYIQNSGQHTACVSAVGCPIIQSGNQDADNYGKGWTSSFIESNMRISKDGLIAAAMVDGKLGGKLAVQRWLGSLYRVGGGSAHA